MARIKTFRFRRKKEVKVINVAKEFIGGKSFVDNSTIPKSKNKIKISPTRLFIKRKKK